MTTHKSIRKLSREEMQSTVGGGIATSPLGVRRVRTLVPMAAGRPVNFGDLVGESNPQPAP